MIDKLKKNKPVIFVICVLICFLAAYIGSLYTAPSIPNWYASLNKPSFNPPNSVFAPVWTLLYFLMAVSLYLVYFAKANKSVKKNAMSWFLIQLVLNVLWSIIFFGNQQIKYAFADIVLLWFAILMTIIKFYRIEKKAAYLLMPYLLWVSFAAVLNLSLMLLN